MLGSLKHDGHIHNQALLHQEGDLGDHRHGLKGNHSTNVANHINQYKNTRLFDALIIDLYWTKKVALVTTDMTLRLILVSKEDITLSAQNIEALGVRYN